MELTLHKDANVYAAQYALYLPDMKLLQDKLNEWMAEIDLLLEKVCAEFVKFLVQNSLLTLVKSTIPRTELLHEVGQGIL